MAIRDVVWSVTMEKAMKFAMPCAMERLYGCGIGMDAWEMASGVPKPDSANGPG